MTDDPADIPKIIRVADGFAVRQEIDNLTWIDMGGYALVVDALEHAEKAGEVFAAIRESLGDTPVRYVLNTHTHYDHVALNEAFRREWGAEVINHHTTAIPPEGRWFEGSRRRALMRPMPGCHTDEDCIVWVPGDRVLLTGDLFGWGLIPLTTSLRDESAGLLLETYARLIDYNAVTVIPGHGPLCGTDDLRRWTEYFRWLIRQAAERIAAGATDADIAAALPPPEHLRAWWRFVKWKHADSVAKVISAVRRDRLHVQ